MSAHLTHEELTERLLGASSMTVEAHLLDCAQCREESEQIASSIGQFRRAAHEWSDAASQQVVPATGAVRHQWRFGVALATAAACLIVVFVWMLNVHNQQVRSNAASANPTHQTTAAPQTQLERDNELLSQINREISEGVPSPMQPLRVSLTNESDSSSNQTQ